MQIDWVTTIAQIINFLVLVYLLKRFLYRPIVTAMNRREAHISQRLEEAARQSAAAKQQTETYNEKIQALERQREELVEEAKREADAQRMQLLDALRDEIAAIRAHWHEEVQRERQAFLDQTRKMLGNQVCLVAQQALGELADAELETKMVDVFLRRVAEVPAPDKTRLAETAREKGLMVQTRFSLSQAMREEITTGIHTQIDAKLAVHFEQKSELICGISLRGPGFKLEWNLDSYLAQIDEQLAEHLNVSPLSE